MESLIWNIYLFLPAYVANSVPVLAAKFKLFENLNTPVDMGKTFGGKRLLGDHKTVRGFVVGISLGCFIGIIQYYLKVYGLFSPILPQLQNFSDYFIFSFLLSSGALIGDSAKSFIKRRLGIPPGETWLIADQLDYIFGAIIVATPFYNLSVQTIFIFISSGFILHILAGIFSCLTGMRKSWI